MNLFFSPSDGELILNTAGQMLEAFRKMCPHAVEDALALLRNGQSAEHAGRVVSDFIQLAQDQLQRETSEKLQVLQNSVSGLTDQIREYEHNLMKVQAEYQLLHGKCDLQESEIANLQETIAIQNRILARQQRQLQSLLGNTSDDEQS